MTAYYLLSPPPSVYVSISQFCRAVPLNDDAKVVLLFETCKYFPK